MQLVSRQSVRFGAAPRQQRRCNVSGPQSRFATRPAVPSRSELRRTWVLRAAEEEAAEAPATSTSSEAAAEQHDQQDQQQPAIERLKAAAAESGDEQMSNTVNELESELAELRERIAIAETKASAAEANLVASKDQYLRLNADFDNYRRRTAQEKDAIAGNVKGDVVKELLPMVDNFELARTQVKAETEGEQKINNSYQSLYKQMVEAMRSFGVEAVPTVGSIFDPNVHEAIMREPNNEVPDGTVLMEFRKGFMLGERLLRPAMVQVSFSDSPAPAAGGEGEGAEVKQEEAVMSE